MCLKRKKWYLSFLALLMTFMMLAAGCGGKGAASDSGAKQQAGSKVTIKMLDVGQGDAVLIRTPEQTVLIDTSDVDEKQKLSAALKKENVKVIDKLIITHPHADHLGGMSVVFNECEVKAVYDNGQPATTKLYRDYLKTIKSKGISYKALRDGDRIDFGGGAVFEVLSPTEEMVKEGGHDEKGKINFNLNSVVGRLVYGDFAMMFTGDAESESEQGIMKRHAPKELKSTILKSGHHGSKTSSSPKFLKAVQPEAALISCGKGNEYHHPHPSTRNKYAKHKIDFYRTDVNGTITVETDGHSYTLTVERGAKNDETGN